MRCIRTFFKCGLPVLLTATVAGSGCRTSRNLQSHDRQSLRDTTATVRSEKDKVAEQLTDDWENWEIVRTEYVLKGRDTVPDATDTGGNQTGHPRTRYQTQHLGQ